MRSYWVHGPKCSLIDANVLEKKIFFSIPLGMPFICAMSRETHFSVHSESELFIICLA